jgi:deoxyribodipyrimidine photo-lyase
VGGGDRHRRRPLFPHLQPISQSKKFDPRGEYLLRRWLPELARVPNKFIHAPWEMAPARQKAAGCIIGQDYPAPIVDHKLARERTLAAYKAARER